MGRADMSSHDRLVAGGKLALVAIELFAMRFSRMLLYRYQIPGLKGTLLAIQINLNAYMPAVNMRPPTLPIIGSI